MAVATWVPGLATVIARLRWRIGGLGLGFHALARPVPVLIRTSFRSAIRLPHQVGPLADAFFKILFSVGHIVSPGQSQLHTSTSVSPEVAEYEGWNCCG